MRIDETGQKYDIAEIDDVRRGAGLKWPDVRNVTAVDLDDAIDDGWGADRNDVASAITNHVRESADAFRARLDIAGARSVTQRIVQLLVRDADLVREQVRKTDVSDLGEGVTIRTQ